MTINVAIDVPRLTNNPLGMQVYIENVLRNLLESADDTVAFTIRTRGLRGLHEHVSRLKRVDKQTRADLRLLRLPSSTYRHLFSQHWFDALYNKQFEIIHVLSAQLVYTQYAKIVTTIQDVIPLRLNEGEPAAIQEVANAWKQLIPASTKIITISNFSKDEIVDVLQVDPEKITVIHNGVDRNWFKPATAADKASNQNLLLSLEIDKPYVLQLGGLIARKNAGATVEAFERLRQQGLDYKLVFAGASAPDELRSKISKCKYSSDIVHCAYLSAADTLRLLQSASLLAFPSLYEGFGMPPLEAMACGVPVVLSKSASLPEVGGDAALYFDAHDVDAMSLAMIELLTNDSLRANVIERGLCRADLFSWVRNAEETIQLYGKIANANGR